MSLMCKIAPGCEKTKGLCKHEKIMLTIAIIAGIALLVFAFAGCGSDGLYGDGGNGGGGTGLAEIVECSGITPSAAVVMQNIACNPSTVTISAGQVVRWTNNDSVSHTVTSGTPGDANAGKDFDIGLIGNGVSKCIKFNAQGTYTYFCRPHSATMRDAQVIV